MQSFSCIMCVENWQAIEKAGGRVSKAGSLWLEYWAESEVDLPIKTVSDFKK
jgi:hypothetical protein